MSKDKTIEKVNHFQQLQAKLISNMNSAIAESNERMNQVETKARTIVEIFDLIQAQNLSPTQKEIANIFNEIFADVITSTYLAGCSLDKPAQIMLRRVLELGISVVYLWDMPHRYYGWRDKDKSLNFSEMVEHITSEGYNILARNENPSFTKEFLFDHKKAELYMENLVILFMAKYLHLKPS